MKCIVCNKRKGKRYCPAKRSDICPICCGEKRGIEIDCPLDCQYFVEGQKNYSKRVAKERVKKEGAKAYVKKAELYSKSPELFSNIEIAISKLYRLNKELTNKDFINGLEQVSKTLDTENKGVIYEYVGENEYSNEVSKTILNLVNDFMASPQAKKVNLNFAISVIDEFVAEAKFYEKMDDGEDSYLRHIARYHPEERKSVEEQGSSLIITP